MEDILVTIGPISLNINWTNVSKIQQFRLEYIKNNKIKSNIDPMYFLEILKFMDNGECDLNDITNKRKFTDYLKYLEINYETCNDTIILSNNDCSICLNEMIEDTMILRCGHMFHNKCIVDCKKNKNECPICRQEIKEYKLITQEMVYRDTIEELKNNNTILYNQIQDTINITKKLCYDNKQLSARIQGNYDTINQLKCIIHNQHNLSTESHILNSHILNRRTYGSYCYHDYFCFQNR